MTREVPELRTHAPASAALVEDSISCREDFLCTIMYIVMCRRVMGVRPLVLSALSARYIVIVAPPDQQFHFHGVGSHGQRLRPRRSREEKSSAQFVCAASVSLSLSVWAIWRYRSLATAAANKSSSGHRSLEWLGYRDPIVWWATSCNVQTTTWAL